MRHLGTGLIVAAALVGALGLFVFFTERGVANEIKGFVLLLVAAVLLVGDEPFYRRFGFCRALTEQLRLPGPFERERFLGLELAPGALAGARGIVTATGAPAPATVPALPTAAPRRLTPRARHGS